MLKSEKRRRLAKNVIDKIELLIDAHLQFVEKNTDFFLVFIKGEKASLSEDMASLYKKLSDGYYDHITFIENLLKDGIDKRCVT